MDAERATVPHGSWEAGAGVVAMRLDTGVVGDQRARAALLDAVLREVAEVGWERAAVAAVCERAGVSTATFLALFCDKQACFMAAGHDFVERVLAHMRGTLRDVEGWETRVRVGLEAFLAYVAAHPHAARALFVEGMALVPDALALRDHALHSFARFVDRRGDGATAQAGPSALISEATVGGVYGIVARRVREGRIDTLPELAASLAYFLLAPVVDRPRAREEPVAVAVAT